MPNIDLPAFFAMVSRFVGGDVAAWQSIAATAAVTIVLLLIVCTLLIARLSRYESAPVTWARYARLRVRRGLAL